MERLLDWVTFIDVAGMRPQCLEQTTTYIKKQLLLAVPYRFIIDSTICLDLHPIFGKTTTSYCKPVHIPVCYFRQLLLAAAIINLLIRNMHGTELLFRKQ